MVEFSNPHIAGPAFGIRIDGAYSKYLVVAKITAFDSVIHIDERTMLALVVIDRGRM